MTNPTTQIRLTHTAINNGDSVRILCDKITVSGTKNIIAKPNATGTDLVEVQTQSFENPVYKIDGIHFMEWANTLSYSDVLTLYKAQYNGNNPAILTVNYGTAETTMLVAACDTTSTDISVILKTFSYPLDIKSSKAAYMPIGNLTFQETA